MKAKQIFACLLVATVLPLPAKARFRGIVIEDDKGEGKKNPPNTNEDRGTLALSDSFGRVGAFVDGEYEYEYDRNNSWITGIRGAKKSKKDKHESKNDKSAKKEKKR
mmetsp:Transcript_2072/g.4471  ORF Transcript_2072/g.4471 Transcript_2072/m.4471 type:complete len:107 (-) Transcript_2072:31-351(-)|eukprot:CAMPEP_0168311684 /NCGR_PEP_ID=MMETSP0142_2-20121227/67494_1 /TAXON_ID=44445 /ORGANISM="Pseudo-nitzschia australis, Strain 10249 10 AB" /LENGTH=106 /DNA_ID=CAMNT_0008264595 /DNA_START=53 /DNA_END=373 /DNA_ORIENTATION=+